MKSILNIFIFFLMISFSTTAMASKQNGDDQGKKEPWKTVHGRKGYTDAEWGDKTAARREKHGVVLSLEDEQVVRLFADAYQTGDQFKKLNNALSEIPAQHKEKLSRLLKVLPYEDRWDGLLCYKNILSHCAKDEAPTFHNLLKEIKNDKDRLVLLQVLSSYVVDGSAKAKKKVSAAHFINIIKILMQDLKNAKKNCGKLVEIEGLNVRGHLVYMASLMPPTLRIGVLRDLIARHKSSGAVSWKVVSECVTELKRDDERSLYLKLFCARTGFEKWPDALCSLVHQCFDLQKKENKLLNLTHLGYLSDASFLEKWELLCEYQHAGKDCFAEAELQNFMQYLIENPTEIVSVNVIRRLPRMSLPDALKLVIHYRTCLPHSVGTCIDLSDLSKLDFSYNQLWRMAHLLSDLDVVTQRSFDFNQMRSFLQQTDKIKGLFQNLENELVKTYFMPSHSPRERLLVASYLSRHSANGPLKKSRCKAGVARLLEAAAFKPEVLFDYASSVETLKEYEALIDAWQTLRLLCAQGGEVERCIEGLMGKDSRVQALISVSRMLTPYTHRKGEENDIQLIFDLAQQKVAVDQAQFEETFKQISPETTLFCRAIIYKLLSWQGISPVQRQSFIATLLSKQAEISSRDHFTVFSQFQPLVEKKDREDIFEAFQKLFVALPARLFSLIRSSVMTSSFISILPKLSSLFAGVSASDFFELNLSNDVFFEVCKRLGGNSYHLVNQKLWGHFFAQEYIDTLNLEQRLALALFIKDATGEIPQAEEHFAQLKSFLDKAPKAWECLKALKDGRLKPEVLEYALFLMGDFIRKDIEESKITFEQVMTACENMMQSNQERGVPHDPRATFTELGREFSSSLCLKERIRLAPFIQKIQSDDVDLKEVYQHFASLPENWQNRFILAIENVDPEMYLPVLPALGVMGKHTKMNKLEDIDAIIHLLQKFFMKGVDINQLVATVVQQKSVCGDVRNIKSFLSLLAVFDTGEWGDAAKPLAQYVCDHGQRTGRALSEQFINDFIACPDKRGFLEAANNRNGLLFECNTGSHEGALMLSAFMLLPEEMRGTIFLRSNNNSPEIFSNYTRSSGFIGAAALTYVQKFVKIEDLKSYWSQQLESKDRNLSNFFATFIFMIADSQTQNFKALRAKALSLKTTYLTEDLDSFDLETAKQASDFVMGNYRELGLTERNEQELPDFLLEKAHWVSRAVYQPDDARNPYRLYRFLQLKRAKHVDFTTLQPKASSTYKQVSFNPAGINAIKLQEIQVKDLPLYDSTFLTQMRRHILEVRKDDLGAIEEHVAQLSYASIGVSQSMSALLEACTAKGKLTSIFHEVQGYDSSVSTTTAKFITVVSYLQSLPLKRPSNELLSPREEMFLSFLAHVPYCDIRKTEGITAFYRLLPRQAQLKSLIAYKDARDEKVCEWVFPIVTDHISDLFYSEHPFVRELSGTNKGNTRDQAVHDVTYLKNALGGVLPLGSLVFDMYTRSDHILSSKLTTRSLNNMLSVFYQHLEVDSLVKKVQGRLSQALNTPKSGAYDAIANLHGEGVDKHQAWEIENDLVQITPYGTVELLKALNILQQQTKE